MSYKVQVIIAGTEPQTWVDCYPRFERGLHAIHYAIALDERDNGILDFQVVEDPREPTHEWDGMRARKLTEKPADVKPDGDVPF